MTEKLFTLLSIFTFGLLLFAKFPATVQSQDGNTVPILTPTASFTPVVTPTMTITATVTPTVTVTPTATVTPTPTVSVSTTLFLPVVLNEASIIVIPPLPDPLPIPLVFTSTTQVDFEAAAAGLEDDGLVLGYNKIGFHTGIGGNREGISDYFKKLDAAGVPIFIKSVDDAGPIFEVQELGEASGIEHIMVYRKHGGGFELPNYDNDPIAEARIHYERHVSAWPPELDYTKVWMETINEPDKNRSEWLAIYSLEVAKLAVADGRKVAAFSWSAGEPEVEHWESQEMLEYFRYAAQHPDNVAVALHEYSLVDSSISRSYPYLVGRFQFLYDLLDKRGIDRPTTIITEWGWAATSVPDVDNSIEDIAWANTLYNAHPEIIGAGLWYLGGNFENIANKAQKLIAPVGDYSVTSYWGITPGKGQIDPSLFYDPEDSTRYMSP